MADFVLEKDLGDTGLETVRIGKKQQTRKFQLRSMFAPKSPQAKKKARGEDDIVLVPQLARIST